MAVYGKIPMFSGNVPGRKSGSRTEGIINLVNHKRKIEILNFKNVKYKRFKLSVLTVHVYMNQMLDYNKLSQT